MSDKWHPRAEWTPAIERRLRQLRREGHSAAAIAAALNRECGTRFTRNAVIGKLHRLKVPAPVMPRAAARKRAHRMRPDSRFAPLGLIIDELTATTCRYPLWGEDSAARLYCGHAVQDGSPYCAHHHRICHVRPDARAALARAA